MKPATPRRRLHSTPQFRPTDAKEKLTGRQAPPPEGPDKLSLYIALSLKLRYVSAICTRGACAALCSPYRNHKEVQYGPGRTGRTAATRNDRNPTRGVLRMNRKLLATAICAGLFMTGSAWAQDQDNGTQSQDQSNSTQPQKKDEKKTLQAVVVTGSLIPQAEIETASPVIKITAEDLSKQGFATAYDALKASPVANGSVQGNLSSGGFTQGAQTISLFGLPVNYTLFLINGKQMTNYPLAYNGSNAFTDLSNIPVAMIDHIDIVPGGNSAIYGSAAIAGVVNIVLKQKYEGVDLDFRGGGYTDGGGQNQRLQLSGGHTWGNLDASFALELLNQ